jgi:hypothetical protein
MKRSLLVFFVLAASFRLSAQDEGIFVEPFSQIQLSSQETDNSPEINMDYMNGARRSDYSIKAVNRTTLGFKLGYSFGNFGFNTGFAYKAQGFKWTSPEDKGSYEKRLDYFQIPLSASWTPKIGDYVSLLASAGMYEDILFSSTDDYFTLYNGAGGPYKRIDATKRHTKYLTGIHAELGTIIWFSTNIGLSLSLVYERDLRDAENKNAVYLPNDVFYKDGAIPIYTPERGAQYNYLYGFRAGLNFVL